MRAVLERIAGSIPDLRRLDPEAARRASGGRTVTPAFVSSMIVCVEASPALLTILGNEFDRDQARRVLRTREPYRLMAEQVAMLLTAINQTRDAQWAEVARAAMKAYKMACTLAAQPGNEYLLPHIKAQRAHLRRAGPKKKTQTKADGEE